MSNVGLGKKVRMSRMVNPVSNKMMAITVDHAISRGIAPMTGLHSIQSTIDKREYRLRPTQKYIDYYNISYSYLHLVMERAKQRFGPDDLAKLEEMLQVVSDELMPEIQLPE